MDLISQVMFSLPGLTPQIMVGQPGCQTGVPATLENSVFLPARSSP